MMKLSYSGLSQRTTISIEISDSQFNDPHTRATYAQLIRRIPEDPVGVTPSGETELQQTEHRAKILAKLLSELYL